MTKTGIAHPVYWTPGFPSLQPFIDYKRQYRSVPVILTFNPYGGVGTARVGWYATEICKCIRAGIEAYGYVYTQWDARDASVVNNEVNYYRKWYSCRGIMYDELSSNTNPPTYVSNLETYADSINMKSIGNPGTSVASNYIGLLDCYFIAEGAGLSDVSWIADTYPGIDKSNFGCIFYDVPTLSDAQIEDIAQYVGYMFISERSAAESPYLNITGYLEQLYSVLDAFPAS